MDQCASVLLAFPHVTENEAYHKSASAHIQRLLRMLKERAKDLVVYSASLFDVCNPSSPTSTCPLVYSPTLVVR